MKLAFYTYPGGDGLPSVSPPCLRVDMALRRAGVEYESVVLRSRSEVRRVSATGRLPVVEFDGRPVCDSIEIMDELERRLPDADLFPKAPAERLRDRLWEHFFNDHVYWLGYYLRWVSPENRKRWLAGLFGQAPFLMRTVGPPILRRATRTRSQQVGIAGKTLEEITRAYERAIEMVETGLAGGPFLDGRPTPGRGDLATASSLCQVGFRDTLPDMQRRARAHPAVIEHSCRVFEACSMKPPRWLQTKP